MTASARRWSIVSRSCWNISGCWSYFVDIYCFIALESETVWVRRKGRASMLPEVLGIMLVTLKNLYRALT